VASEMRLGFGHVFVESISNVEMRESFGTVGSLGTLSKRGAL